MGSALEKVNLGLNSLLNNALSLFHCKGLQELAPNLRLSDANSRFFAYFGKRLDLDL